jgi:sec-independent protein translocase protein TatB
MFDVSFTELMVIGVIALIVIGPERLPKVARTVGHLLGRAQRYANDVKADIRREIELDELRKFKSDMDNATQSVQTSLRDAQLSLLEPTQALQQELGEATSAITRAVSIHVEPTPATSTETSPATPVAVTPMSNTATQTLELASDNMPNPQTPTGNAT